jgi:DNA-binding NtrC family response regulator
METQDRPRILIVDDDPYVLEALEASFEDDYDVTTATSGAEAIEVVRQSSDLATVVMDIKMPGMDGIQATREIRKLEPELPVILHTAYPGDYDEDRIDQNEKPDAYIVKAGPESRLARAVRNGVEKRRLKIDNRALLRLAGQSWGLVGESPAMLAIFRQIHRLGPTQVPVMIFGETGTGKELVAQALHMVSRAADRQIQILECNHKNPTLIEADLFGTDKGAYTDAVDRPGLVERADGGTLFLDEIGDLDSTTQAKLLRVTERGEYERVGGKERRSSSFRLICATHRDLKQMVADGKFREDFYYRLEGSTITMPPLRERREDISHLANHFAREFADDCGRLNTVFDKPAMDILASYDWPGNVRQLQRVVRQTMLHCDSGLIMADDVSRTLDMKPAVRSDDDLTLTERLMEHRRELIRDALRGADGNVAAAARTLRCDAAWLRKIIKEGIENSGE